MTEGKIGFLHDYDFDFAEAVSETDAESKYGVESSASIEEDAVDIAELSVVEADSGTDLNASGMKVSVINTGPIEDVHSNYRYEPEIPDIYLGKARFGVTDGDDGVGTEVKARDEYWSMNSYENLPNATADSDLHAGHSDGEVMMYAGTDSPLTSQDQISVYVSTRNESTGTWGAYVLVETIWRHFGTTPTKIDPSPAFCTVPSIGTFLFYYAIDRDDDDGLNYSNQVIRVALTKDHGVSWDVYGTIQLDPFYGPVWPGEDNRPLAELGTAVLKATFYNNRIILGTMLLGSTDNLETIIGVGTAGVNDSFSGSVSGSYWLYEPGEYELWNDTQRVGYDDGQGVFVPDTGFTLTGTIDYTTGAYTVDENGTQTWADSVDAKIVINKVRANRILNLMYSDTLYKSWTTIQTEFLTAAFTGDYPAGAYILGSGFYSLSLPKAFGLGIERQSDKTVLFVRGCGQYNFSPATYDNIVNIARLHVFYNKDDEMKVWEKSTTKGRPFRLTDDFQIDTSSKYVFTLNGTWEIKDGYLNQTESSAGVSRAVYDIVSDFTFNRSRGVRATFNTSGLGSGSQFGGFGFCYQGTTQNYLVRIDANLLATAGTVDVQLFDGVTPFGSPVTISYTQNTDMEIDVQFVGDYIEVYINGAQLISVKDNTYRTGKAFFYSDDLICKFTNFGLLDTTIQNAIPGGLNPVTTHSSYKCNMDTFVDEYGTSWIVADTDYVAFGSSLTLTRGIVLQKFVLERDIERVEGKLLSKDKLFIKYGDDIRYHEDVGHWFNKHNYSIFPQYPTTTAGIATEGAVWHNGSPYIFSLRGSSTAPRQWLIYRNVYSDVTLQQNMSSTYNIVGYDASLTQSGWFETGTVAPDATARAVSFTLPANAQQHINLNTPAITSAGIEVEEDVPLQFIDTSNGLVLYFNTKGDVFNDTNVQRDIVDVITPNRKENTNELNPSRFRVVYVEQTSVGANDAKIQVYDDQDGSPTWALLGEITGLPGNINTAWREFIVQVVPEKLAQQTPSPHPYPHIYVWYRIEGESVWTSIVDNAQLTQYSDTTLTNYQAMIKFGAFNGSGTQKQEFKFFGWSDTCSTNPTYNQAFYTSPISANIRGESAKAGGNIHLTKGIVVGIGGGNVQEGQYWTISDLTRRDFSREAALDKPTSVWRSDDDTADKAIIFDAKMVKRFDTIGLYGVNCRDIRLEANTINDFSAPPFSTDISMVEHSEKYEKDTSQTNKSIEIISMFKPFNQGELFDKRFTAEEHTVNGTSLYRVTNNAFGYITYDTDSSAEIPLTSNEDIEILSDRILLKLNTLQSYRFFRLTFRTAGLVDPTVEGYFQLGTFALGIFDQMDFNPEYQPGRTPRPHVQRKKLASGTMRPARVAGPPTEEHELQFRALSTVSGGELERLRAVFRHSERGTKPVFYARNIDTNESASPVGVYTFDFIMGRIQNNFRFNTKAGRLADIRLVIKETN